METSKIERVRGTNDWLPGTFEHFSRIRQTLESNLEVFGYRPVDVPVLEHTDLYLKKAGEDIAPNLYDFFFRNRRLALRPEITASVTRAFIDNLQGMPLPVRLYHTGPVFRYEKPQSGRYRQFTQTDVELIGASGDMADAELIYAASKGLTQVGLDNHRIVIGHIGILHEFLDGLALNERLVSFLIANMERLRKRGKQYVTERLRELYQLLPAEASGEVADRAQPATSPMGLLQKLSEEEARTVVLELLDSMNIELIGRRSPDEIVDRLLSKMKRQEQWPQIDKALDFMHDLGQLTGQPSAVLREASRLLDAYGISRAPLDRLEAIAAILSEYKLSQELIRFDLGLSRGIRYYTGTIFEVYHETDGESRQICGGGRYDDLVVMLGGPEGVSAAGFSYGLERVYFALKSEGKITDAQRTVDVLVIPVSVTDRAYALELAERMRAGGLHTELNVRERSVRSSFQYADKSQIRFVVVIGSEERQTNQVVVKDMRTRIEHKVDTDGAVDYLKKVK